MKKLLAFLTCCVAVLSVSITTYAAKDKTDTYEYEVRDGKAVLMRYATTSNAVRVTVPEEVDGYQVVGLEGTFEQNQRVEEVLLPQGIEFLGPNTFSRCRQLKSIQLPEGLITVGDNCFSYTKLNSIEFPASVNYIGIGCIQNSDVSSVKINSTDIWAYMNFSDSESLETVDLRDSEIENIPAMAFWNCKNLNTVYFPDTLKKIERVAFSYCQSLNNVVLPDGLEIIEDTAFSNCIALEGIVFPDTLKEIDVCAFYNCTKLNNIALPNSIEKIGDQAFDKCDSIEEFVIPDTSKSLSIDFLFVSGQNLKRIVNNSDMDYDETTYIDLENNQYAWYLDEEFTQEAKYLPAKTTIYRKDNRDIDQGDGDTDVDQGDSDTDDDQKDEEKVSEKYLELYEQNILSETIYAHEINTKEQLMEYLEKKKPDSNGEIECDVKITYFAEGSRPTPLSGPNGSAKVLLKATNKNNPLDVSELTVKISIVYVEDKLEREFIDKCKELLSDLESTGISMSVVNSAQEAKRYIENLVSKDKDEKLSVQVNLAMQPGNGTTVDFKKAVAGTYQNPKGTDGYFLVEVNVKNTGLRNDLGSLSTSELKKGWYRIPIKATPYKSSSSGSSGGSGGNGGGSGSSSGSKASSNTGTAPGSGLNISKPSVTQGTWELTDGKWKLKLPDDSYASSQWASLSGKWYLMGADGVMLTDWQKVNGKWYLLGQDGAMLTGWQFHNGKWYYMEPSGEMVVGWKWILDKCYYMDSNGAMLANTVTPDGYQVNSNGEWVQ